MIENERMRFMMVQQMPPPRRDVICWPITEHSPPNCWISAPPCPRVNHVMSVGPNSQMKII
ncbi:hypothetical protein M404DRAFT_998901 [Pisolithus tinctorius Marx 270]|uniref:Uncharacterized protein n=1 Tax=Pisolithus tinctorius Marx 270 TaxID=870435 RepID=A0A0C3KB10_PISTI|nr:hypothetical protein M404DRAFT_998901 [Pisolithus tinctorius Marx 270]